jgi:hypothetical protein
VERLLRQETQDDLGFAPLSAAGGVMTGLLTTVAA